VGFTGNICLTSYNNQLQAAILYISDNIEYPADMTISNGKPIFELSTKTRPSFQS